MKKRNKPTSPCILKKIALRTGALVCALAIAVLMLPASAPHLSASKLTDSKVQNYEAQIDKLNRDMENLKNQMSNAKSQIEQTIAKKELLDAEMNILIQKIDVTTALVSELSSSIEQKNTEILDKEQAYAEKYALFKERLRVTHEDGQASYLEMLFGAKSLSDFLARIDRIGAMLEYDTMIMNSLKTEKADLEGARANYQTQKAAQESYLAGLRTDEAALESKKKEAEGYLTALERDQASYVALYEKNLAAEEALQAELQAYLKELEAKQNNKYVGGQFMWPVPLDYVRVTSEYGGRTSPITGKYEFHNGIDIPAAYGTSIYASNAGTVTVATNHWSYGNYIMVDHGGGYATLYAHCSKLLVKKGDKVKKGDVIAKVGSTGYSTGNHLHFSMYESSAHTDPRKWFPK